MPVTHSVVATVPDDPAFEVKTSGWNDDHVGARDVLSANIFVYVATTGNDTTGDGTVGNPWLTITRAYAYIIGNGTDPGLDLNGWAVVIQLADGTYNYTGPPCLNINTSWVGGGVVYIQGNGADPSAVVLSGDGAGGSTCITVAQVGALPGQLWIYSLTFEQAHAAVVALAPCQIILENIIYGSGLNNHIEAAYAGAQVYVTGTEEITDDSGSHLWARLGGAIEWSPSTCTLTGTPAFGPAFVTCEDALGSFIVCQGSTIVGSCTGKRYQAYGSIQNLGVAIPGSLPGVVYGNGQYLFISSSAQPYIITASDGGRNVLTADITIYVNGATGNDTGANDGMTSGSPFDTLQVASDFVTDQIDLNAHIVTIDIANGTYVGVAMRGYYNSGDNYGGVYWTGDAVTPSNVIVNSQAIGQQPYPFTLDRSNIGGVSIYIDGVRVVCSTGGFFSANPLFCGPKYAGSIILGTPSTGCNIECASGGSNGGSLFLGNVSDNGGAILIDGASLPNPCPPCFDVGDGEGTMGPLYGTYTITGTPTFRELFLIVQTQNAFFFGALSGSYHGPPYTIARGGYIEVAQVFGGLAALGGDAAGVVSAGGFTWEFTGTEVGPKNWGISPQLQWSDTSGKLTVGTSGLSSSVRFAKGGIEFVETTTASIAAAASNEAVLFCQDNGGGKTQIAVRFPTGAVQVIATEP